MKKYIFLILGLALLFSSRIFVVYAQQAPNNPLNNPDPTSPSVNIIGDSITLGAENYLKTAFPNSTFSAVESRQWDEGIPIIQRLASDGKLGRVIVYALGTNGPTDDAGIDQVMQLTGNSKVIFMTIYGTTPVMQDNAAKQNAVINNAFSRYPERIAIADWYAVASLHPEWFDSLGVHPTTTEGQQAFAQTITKATGSSTFSAFQPGITNSSTVKSNMMCVKVGTPGTDKPAICNETTSTSILNFGQGTPGDFTYYCQGNPQWDEKGNACSIGQIGCGPTSLAMIFSYFGDTITPDLMYKTYSSNGMINCSVGSFPGLVNSWVAKQPGYEVGPDIGSGVLNATEAKKYIDAGWLILASSDNFIGQKGNPIGHIFVVQDVDPAAGTFILRDPENCNYGTGEEFTKNIVQPILGGKVPSWKYAYPIRKNATQPQPVPGANQNAF